MTAQEALWYLPTQAGPWWNIGVALLAGPAVLIMFTAMVLNHPFNSLLVARILMLGSFVAFAMVPLNSGYLPWGALLASSGGLLTSILVATDWCNRPDPSVTVRVALWRWLVGLVRGAVCWLCGPLKPLFQDKGVWK